MDIRPSASIRSFILNLKITTVFGLGWLLFAIVSFTTLAMVGYFFIPKDQVVVIKDQKKICASLIGRVNFENECRQATIDRYPNRICTTSMFPTSDNILQSSCYICNMECYLPGHEPEDE